jgi:membrane protein YdbS with pleckstrin-like domain
LIRFSRRHHNVTQVLTAAECRDLAQLEAVQRERAQQLKTHVNQGAQVRLRRNVHFLL